MGAREDDRRRIPRTDVLLNDAEVRSAGRDKSVAEVEFVVRGVLARARSGQLGVDDVRAQVLSEVASPTYSGTPVLNATGVVVHTNLGRAPLSSGAVSAMVAAAGYVDVELDLATGRRGPRGLATREALLRCVPAAEDALIVNNGAAALTLVCTMLAQDGEVLLSRGEMVEIGDGFRIPPLIESTGVRLREVGMTNRTRLADYADAIGPRTRAILKVHPSNFRVSGFTTSVGFAELRTLGLPVIADVGSGLLSPDPALPDEPDAATTLRDGADLVIASGDKLLGGPQAGIILGSSALVERARRHPLARALRVDKITLAALEATLRGVEAPVPHYLHLDPARHEERTRRLADRLGATVVEVTGRVGGGGAPEVGLPGWAVVLPEACALHLRRGRPTVLARVEQGQCLLDVRCIPEESEEALESAVQFALSQV
ncbi:L-seryl-tRNA(Sec) selenium transferase [Knoellia sp. CPCC 206453]|uniref:L-seryl-tRNA(Sec) selenium transferase n=1 Tax=Knoellia pratensis TaxID=3404796 RepID=UPI0036098588